MTKFVQLHALAAYPAGNVNRDDTGRPKTLLYGGAERLRISSQSLKRAMRTSSVFAELLGGALGVRSARFASGLVVALKARGLKDAEAIARAEWVIEHERLGKVRRGTAQTEQLVHLGPDELAALEGLADRLLRTFPLEDDALLVLRERPRAADIAMFGRMLADQPTRNVDAAVQVAHAFTTHRAYVEDDYFTAIDDAGTPGAAFIGLSEFGAGIFYLYVCIDTDLLRENLSGDEALCEAAIAAAVQSVLTTPPTGRQNAFASRVKASYALLEVGEESPRTLGSAFLAPVGETPIARLRGLRAAFGRTYDERFEATVESNVLRPDSAPVSELVQAARAAIGRL
jgi:CRISPR system Cascade subunit CasC